VERNHHKWLVSRKFWSVEELENYLLAKSEGHHPIDQLEDRSTEEESTRRYSLKGRERAIVNQTNIETTSKTT